LEVMGEEVFARETFYKNLIQMPKNDKTKANYTLRTTWELVVFIGIDLNTFWGDKFFRLVLHIAWA